MSEEESQEISRRTLLKRVGVGAAVVWTAPVITSIMTPAFAASLPAGGCHAFGSYGYDFGSVIFDVTCDGSGNCSGYLDYTDVPGTSSFHQEAVCGGCLCGETESSVWFGGPITAATGFEVPNLGGWSIQRNTDRSGPPGDSTAGIQDGPGGPTPCDAASAGPDYFISTGDIIVTCS